MKFFPRIVVAKSNGTSVWSKLNIREDTGQLAPFRFHYERQIASSPVLLTLKLRLEVALVT